MPVNFNPAKIKNIYALLAAFVLAVGTFFVTWIKSIDKGNSENKEERILMGVFAIVLFGVLIVFTYKILSQYYQGNNNSEHKSKKRKEVTEFANQEVILSKLRELMREYIEKKDLIKVQQINALISDIEKQQKVVMTSADKPDSSPQRDRSNIYSHILTTNR